MATISSIATRILDTNGFQLKNLPKTSAGATCTLTIVEYLIDDAIDYVNMQINPEADGGPIPSLSGTAESKSLGGTRSEQFCVKQVVSLLLRAFKDKGPSASLANLSVQQITSDPHYVITTSLMQGAIDRLRKTHDELEASVG
jgi:hypothetical protein